MFRFAAVVLLGCAAPLLAQTAATPDGTPPASPGGQHRGHMGGPGMRGGMQGMPAAIANAPVTAQYTTSGQMTGRDGQQHTLSGTRTVYRDSLGRTREDVMFAPTAAAPLASTAENGTPRAHGPMNMTVIVDPVAGTVTRLNTGRRTAVVETVPAQFFQRSQKREQMEQSGQAGGRNAQVASLGSKTIAGVVANGETITRTMPAREPGGTTQTITREVWFSPDLKLEVSSTETGDHGTRSETATSISKVEPDASLFKVPEGYTLTQAAPHNDMRHGPHMPQGANGEQDTPPPSM